MEWISVKDRLPEKDGKYLCAICYSGWTDYDILTFDLGPSDRSGVFQGMDINGYWCDIADVDYWMPIPDPSKEAEHGQV